MEKTKDYNIFKKMSGNRALDPCNLKKVINSIRLSNLLEHRPILVNAKMEVIDGQHRLEAAKVLGLEIYYTVKNDASPDDMHILNSAQKVWGLDDHLSFHASTGKLNFQKLAKFCEKKGIRVIDFLTLSGLRNATCTKTFKNGTMDFGDLDKKFSDVSHKLDFIESVVSLIDSMVLGDKSYLTSKLMNRSLASLTGVVGFNEELFISKLKSNLSRMRGCRSSLEYFDMFKGFYNYRNSDPLP